LNIALAVAMWTDYHSIFFRVENLFIHFSSRSSEDIQIILKKRIFK